VLETDRAIAEPNVPPDHSSVSASSADPDVRTPRISHNVRLAGKMNGLGFRDQQWLIDCDGRLLQVSELLYRVAEEADGTHTLKQIADAVSSSTEWSLDGADVEHLITAKLIPLGVVGTVARDEERRSSPLGINVKFRTLSPRFIEPITSVLHLLCNWPIVAFVVLSAGVGHWWLYKFTASREELKMPFTRRVGS